MNKLVQKISIGLRLKLAVSVLVSIVIIALGIVLYKYQKAIIFEQAKQNSYATIDDLIRFTQNEIDASKNKVAYFGKAVLNHIDALGDYRVDTAELITYTANNARTNEQFPISIPAIYRGDTRLQGYSNIYEELKEIGIEYFIYFQKADDYFVEILASGNKQGLEENATVAYPTDYSDLWQLNNTEDSAFTNSYWASRLWVQIVRLYTYDENNQINGAIVAGIAERDENKLGQTYLNKHFYETGVCYQLSVNNEITFHPNIPNFYQSDNPAILQIVKEQRADSPAYILTEDSVGISKYFFYKYFRATYNNVIVEIPQDEIFSSLFALRNGIVIAIVVVVLCIYLILTGQTNWMTNRLDKAVNVLKRLALGDTTSDDNMNLEYEDEIGNIAHSVVDLRQNLNKIAEFAESIGQGKLDTKYEPLSDDDQLGNSLIEMQKSLIKAKEDEKLAQAEEEKNRWASTGLANFSEIIRISDNDIKDLAYNILKNLVSYLNISMGALYIAEKEDDELVYVPQATVAYERRKILKTKIRIGEGLIGRCAFEKKTIYMTDIPDNYIRIRSGMGDANPGYLLIVPLISNEEVLGVIELASFNEFETYKKDFIEKLAESIGSTLNSAKVNEQTVKLLEQSKLQSEELAAQEEEMRQNMEELQSTQEEAQRREIEMLGIIESIDKSVFKVEYNLSGNIINVNEKYAQFLETEIDALIQKSLFSEFDLLGTTSENADTILRNCASGQNYLTTIQCHINGKSYSLEEHYTPIILSGEELPERIIKISYVVS